MDLPRGAEHGSGVEAVSAHHPVGTESEASAVCRTAELTVLESVTTVQDDHEFETALMSEFCGSKHCEVMGLFRLGLGVSSEEDTDSVLSEEGLRISTALCGWSVVGCATSCHKDHCAEERGYRTRRRRACHGGRW